MDEALGMASAFYVRTTKRRYLARKILSWSILRDESHVTHETPSVGDIHEPDITAFVFAMAFRARQFFVCGDLVRMMHRSCVAFDAGFVFNGPNRVVPRDESLSESPCRVALLAVVFDKSVRFGHGARDVDGLLISRHPPRDPAETHHSGGNAGPPRDAAKSIPAPVEFDLHPFREKSARALAGHAGVSEFWMWCLVWVQAVAAR